MKIVIVSVATGGTTIAAAPPRSARIAVTMSHLRAFLTSSSDRRRSLNHAVMMPAGATSTWAKRSVRGWAIAESSFE